MPREADPGIFWSVFAMLSFFASNVAAQITASRGVDTLVGTILRALGTCAAGTGFLLYSYGAGSFKSALLPFDESSMMLWLLPFLVTCLQLLGVAAVTHAFRNP